MRKIIFNLPCAGGRARNYDRWYLNEECELINIEYPGHWERWEEPLCNDYIDLLANIEKQILDHIEMASDIYLVGHSMGALLACLVAKRSSIEKYIKGIVIIAMVAPTKAKSLKFKNLTDVEEVKNFLRTLRQVPDKVLNSDFFLENLFHPIKSDFEVFNTMVEDIGIFKKIEIPCLVIYSEEDPIIPEKDIAAWGDYLKKITYVRMKGNHFFLYNSRFVQDICDEINGFIENN